MIGKKFKISNVPAGVDSFIWFGSVMLFIVMGGAIFASFKPRGTVAGIGITLLIVLAFGAPVFFYCASKAEVVFDGKFIRLRTMFGKKEIDLQKVEKLTYDLDTFPTRSGSQSISVRFVYYRNSEGYNESDVLYDTVTRDELPKLVKGDHSDCPLLQLYDEMIALYPEKYAGSEGTDGF